MQRMFSAATAVGLLTGRNSPALGFGGGGGGGGCWEGLFSLRDFSYPPLHRFHRTSLHRRRYFTLFLKSASPSPVLSPGTSLGWPNIMAHRVKTATCTSYSTYDRGRLFTAISTSSEYFLMLIPRKASSTNTLLQCPFYEAHKSVKLPPPPPQPTTGLCLD